MRNNFASGKNVLGVGVVVDERVFTKNGMRGLLICKDVQ